MYIETDDLPHRALLFAEAAHAAADQRRKYTNEPYIEHPKAVAALVVTVPGHTPVMVAAAYLHDVLEDTFVTIEQVRAEFGDEVAALVTELTDVSTAADGSRAARKAKDREHLASASVEARTIKLADMLDNTPSIVRCDRKFARVYLPEKAALLAVLKPGTDPTLFRLVRKALLDAQSHLDEGGRA